MTFFDTNKGGAKSTDPATSHAAAKSIDKAAMEDLVCDTLRHNGPLTIEEVGELTDLKIPTVSPRFAPLCRKNRILACRYADGSPVTKAGASGAQRGVYEYQPNERLWLDDDPGGKVEKDNTYFNLGLETAALEAEEWDDGDEIATAIRGLKK
jgi:hypothetical protein